MTFLRVGVDVFGVILKKCAQENVHLCQWEAERKVHRSKDPHRCEQKLCIWFNKSTNCPLSPVYSISKFYESDLINPLIGLTSRDEPQKISKWQLVTWNPNDRNSLELSGIPGLARFSSLSPNSVPCYPHIGTNFQQIKVEIILAQDE